MDISFTIYAVINRLIPYQFNIKNKFPEVSANRDLKISKYGGGSNYGRHYI